MFFIFSALRHITFCGVFFALHYVFVSIAVLCFAHFVFCFFAHIGKLQAIILEVREAGWVGVEADPVDLTFQDLQVFDDIHCLIVSMLIIAEYGWWERTTLTAR